MPIHEMLGYTQHRPRFVSKEEMEARRQFILSHDIAKPGDSELPHKPLDSYQDGHRTLPDLVQERHKDEMSRLEAEYDPLKKWPDCPQMHAYAHRKKQMEEDYQAQERWVSMYRRIDNDTQNISHSNCQYALIASGFCVSGTALLLSGQPTAAALFYLGAAINFMGISSNNWVKKNLAESNHEIQVVLEDWHKEDPFARHDRIKLNKRLNRLNKKKPTQMRRKQKRILVAEYRKKHPRKPSRSNERAA